MRSECLYSLVVTPEGYADSRRASNMMATLEMIRQLYGSAEGYMTQQCGLSKEEVDRIRKNLTVEAFPVH